MPSVTGSISADISLAAGRTQLRRHAQSYPLKIAKTFLFPNDQLGIYMMDASPGMMAGDCYELEFRIGEGADVLITNQSYTKVHPAKGGAEGDGADSRQLQRLEIGRDAYVEYMPEPLMLYREASLISDTEVRMERGSALLYSELLCPGRTHRGELFQFRKLRSRLMVMYDGEPIYMSKQQLEPQHSEVGLLPRWSRYTHMGSLYLFSERVTPELVEALRERLDAARTGKALYIGVSLTYRFGLAVTVMGTRVFELQRLLHEAWSQLRSSVFNRPALVIPK